MGASGSPGPGSPLPRPPEPEGRARPVGCGNSAISFRGPAQAKRGGGGFASFCRALPGPGNNGRLGMGAEGEGEGTETCARGQSLTPARGKLLFAPFLSGSEARARARDGRLRAK